MLFIIYHIGNLEADLSSTSLMKTFLTICLLLSALVLPLTTVAQTSAEVRFTFTLAIKSSTSAGVFTKEGVLIRTLWSGVTYPAGIHTEAWDRLDDEGKGVPQTGYDIRVLSNNVTYTWEGTIGNTSTALTGPTKRRSYEQIHGMAIAGNTAYYALGYSEGNTTTEQFKLTNPQSRTVVLAGEGGGEFVEHLATDGTNVYWGAQDPFAKNNCFVFATQVATNNQTTFANGRAVSLERGRTFTSAINYINNTAAKISGIAVQKTGDYLFVAHQGLNQLRVLHKTTGALVRSITISAPRGVTIDSQNNLWLISGVGAGTVRQYTIQSNGTLSAPTLTLAGLVEPLAMAVSPDSKTLLVADGATSQQIIAYDNVTGQLLWGYGKTGGYQVDARVGNDKFLFRYAAVRTVGTFIAFTPNGSFWVGDSGNCRVQHYGANRQYLERIMYLPHFYNSCVDANDPTRVFAGFLEFKVDYTKPLAPNNGSWSLVRNYSGNLDSTYDDKYRRLRFVATLSNGRTYGFIHRTAPRANVNQLVELPTTGLLRLTGFELSTADYTQLYGDGSLRKQSRFVLNTPTTWTRRNLTGFDSRNNPQWGPEVVVVQSPNATNQDPLFRGNDAMLRSGEVTASNVGIAFDGTIPPNGSSGYHLGGLQAGTNKWLWRTAKVTHDRYTGVYPDDGAYDIGNNVKHAGNQAVVSGRHIIWGYRGEFWKNGQTNKYTHVYDNGLMLNAFGTSSFEQLETSAPAGMAGNVFTLSLVNDQLSAGNRMYLYHNDGAAHHGGIHRWLVSGLTTVREQTIEIMLPGSVTTTIEVDEGIDLLAGLPFNKVLGATTAGWVRSPPEQDTTDQYSSYWDVRTSVKSYKKPDLYAQFRKPSGTYTVSRDLGDVEVGPSWNLQGKVGFWGTMPNRDKGGVYLEVLDKLGKSIARFYTTIFYDSEVYTYNVHGNTALLATGPQDAMKLVVDVGQPLAMQVSAAGVRFQYANYPPVTAPFVDATADWQAPKTVRMYFFNNGNGTTNFERIMDLESLRLYPNNRLLAADLSLSMQTDKRILQINEPTNFLVRLTNSSAVDSGNPVRATWTCQLPPNLELVSSDGLSYDNRTLTGSVSNLPALTDTVFQFKVVPKTAGTYRTTAQITTASLSDPDSKPGSGTGDGEDDRGEVDVRTTDSFENQVFTSPGISQDGPAPLLAPEPDTDADLVDLGLSMALGNRVLAVNDLVSCTLLIRNQGRKEALNIAIESLLPSGLQFVDGTNWSVTGEAPTCRISRLPVGATVSVSFRVRAKVAGDWIIKAQVVEANPADRDSTAGNGYTNGEDDQAQTDLRIR